MTYTKKITNKNMKREEIINEYTELYQKYYSERCLKLKEYRKKNKLSLDDTINSTDHPDYFRIEKEWEEKKKIIDIPILKMAKYRIGEEVEFEKLNIWYDETFSILKDEIVLSHGKIKEIKLSGKGNGEILYCFETLVPPCPEINPYCTEKDIINIF